MNITLTCVESIGRPIDTASVCTCMRLEDYLVITTTKSMFSAFYLSCGLYTFVAVC